MVCEELLLSRWCPFLNRFSTLITSHARSCIVNTMLRHSLVRAVPRASTIGADFARRRTFVPADNSRERAGQSFTADPPPARASTSSTHAPRNSRDCFELLGLSLPTSRHQYTESDFKKAFRDRARQCHPDKTGGDDTDFRNVKTAFDFLRSNPMSMGLDDEAVAGPSAASTGSGFYNHPHHSAASRARERTRHTHTTRTRWDDRTQRGVYDDPDETGGFVKYAMDWGDAIKLGRGHEFLRERREAWRREQAEKAQDTERRTAGMTAEARAAFDADRRQGRAFLLWTTAKWIIVCGIVSVGVKTVVATILVSRELQKLSAYPEKYIASLPAAPSTPSPAPPSPALEALQRRLDFDRPRSSYTTALTYKGQPFTPAGVRAAARKGGVVPGAQEYVDDGDAVQE